MLQRYLMHCWCDVKQHLTNWRFGKARDTITLSLNSKYTCTTSLMPKARPYGWQCLSPLRIESHSREYLVWERLSLRLLKVGGFPVTQVSSTIRELTATIWVERLGRRTPFNKNWTRTHNWFCITDESTFKLS